MLPVVGMIGGGLDMSRLYLTKTRLHRGCDAGALAGRKAMGSGSWSTTKGDVAAKKMFQANLADNAYGSSAMTESFSETDGTVTEIGRASSRERVCQYV